MPTAMLVLLESLSPLERAVFVLREAFGYSYAEIAELVGRSEASVRQTPAGRASTSSSGGSVANLAIAGTFVAVLVARDLFSTLPLPFGVAGREGSTVFAGLNGLPLLRSRVWPDGHGAPLCRKRTEDATHDELSRSQW